MPTSRSPFGVNIAPLPFPDFQTDINKQLSFWNTMQQMQRRAAGISGGGRVSRNENGLTPYQQAQMDYKKAKDEAKAVEAEAKKNVMLGLDPVSKEPIIYRNESGQNLTQKDRDRLLADELQRRLKNAAGQDVELNKALGELNSGTELSTQRRSELQRVVRDRTKALGREYGIDDRATFDAIIGPSKQVLDEQRQALRNDSFLDTVWAGMRKGGNALYYALASPWPWVSDADRLENARKMREEQEAITRSSPTLQERALVEAEAAREGKDVGYMQAAQANLASNIGASVADTVTSFAPAIAAGMIPVVGTYAAPFLAGGIGAGLNQVSQAARVEADPNLTEAQKQQALSYSDPGFVGTSVIGGATGAMFPGSIGSGIARGAGSAAFRRAAAAGPINPAKVTGLTGKALRAGARATERAAAPRSLAALSRDVPVNMAENAGLMAANTVGANVAYNMSTGQPLTQGAMEGVGRAAMEGAVVGVPFGIGRTLRRRAAPTAQATTEGTVSPTGEPANTQPVSIFEQAMKADTAAQEWKRDLLKTVVNPRKVKTEDANKLIAEYLDTVDTTVDGWRDEMSARLVSIDDLPRWNKMNDNSAAALRKVVDTWKGALDDGTIAEKIASNYQRPAEGESRLASYVGELERVRAERAAGQGSGNDSKVATNPADSASDVASGNPVQNNAGGAETPGGGDGGTAAPHVRATEADATAFALKGILPSAAKNKPANAGSPGIGGKSSGNGAGELAPPTVGRDGSTGDANATGGGEQSVEPVVISIGEPVKVGAIKRAIITQDSIYTDSNGMKYDATFVRMGSKAKPQWFWKPDKSKKSYKVSPEHNARLEQAYQQKLGEAKGINPKGEIRESRASREQRGNRTSRIAVSSHSPYIVSYAGKQWIEKRDADNPRIRHYYDNDGQVADEATAYALDKLAYKRSVEEVKTELSHLVEVEERNIENAEHELRQLDKYGPDPYDEALSRDELVAYLKREQNFLARYKGALKFLEQSDEVHVLNNQSRAEAVASNNLPENLRRLFTTRGEKQILADLDSSDINADYVENMKRALEVILDKLPGLKTKEANVYLEYSGANAIYDPTNYVIGMNLYGSAGSSSEILQRMNHEIGHGTQREIGNPSTNTFINTEVYRDASPAMRADVEDAYSRYRSEDFYGEEVYSELASGELPFVDVESARAGILELYDSVPSDKKTRLYSQAMSFFAQYADQGTYSTFVKNAILSSDAHRNMFLHGDTSSIENGLARGLVQDYQNLTDIAGVPRNKETLGVYLDELLDPTTELNVFKRQSVVC